jgi:hypothetical protein
MKESPDAQNQRLTRQWWLVGTDRQAWMVHGSRPVSMAMDGQIGLPNRSLDLVKGIARANSCDRD